jgi:hypothetical protein
MCLLYGSLISQIALITNARDELPSISPEARGGGGTVMITNLVNLQNFSAVLHRVIVNNFRGATNNVNFDKKHILSTIEHFYVKT